MHAVALSGSAAPAHPLAESHTLRSSSHVTVAPVGTGAALALAN
jgi:hypothetical protein